MRHLIPFRPLINFLIVIISNRGIHWKQSSALLPWILKTILFEPLRLVEAFYFQLRKPAVKRQPPVFILGFYRSGTTWLQQLIATDPDFKTPTVFQTVLPEFMLLLEPVLKPLLKFISNKLHAKNPFHRLPFSWDFPGEEDVAINSLSYLCDFNRLFQYPSRYQRLLNSHFIRPHKELIDEWGGAHYYYTSKLSLKYPRKRLLLKSPPNTGRIALLKKLYPGAKFIFIKREVVACIYSNKRLWEINRNFSFENYDEKSAENIIIHMYKVFHQQYAEEKKMLKPDELVEVTYEDLKAYPMRVVDEIYAKLHLENNEEKINLRKELINQRSEYKPLDHLIDRDLMHSLKVQLKNE